MTTNTLLVEMAGVPRMRDVTLAERLGYEQPRKIRDLIEVHQNALWNFGMIKSEPDLNTDPLGRGRPGKSYWLNRKQVLYICAKSQAARAAEVTIAMVEVFDAWLEGKTVPVKEHARRRPHKDAEPEMRQEVRQDLPPFAFETEAAEVIGPRGQKLWSVSALVEGTTAVQMFNLFLRMEEAVTAGRPTDKLIAIAA